MDSLMFSRPDLISRWAGIVFESWYIFSFLIFGFVMSVLCRTFFHSPAERISDRKANRS